MSNKKSKISIVTPSFNMLPMLKLCHASVVDQEIDSEHIIVDGKSADGTVQWLSETKDIIFVSEKDKGMYDALNKAISMTNAEIIGHLNCDEQYLPGTLQFVKKYFDENPEVDFIAGDFIVINPKGEFVAFRKSFRPQWQFFFSNYLYTTTCTLFYRRKIFNECRFDDSYKSIADVIFLYNVIKKGFKGVHVRKYFSVFTFSGSNLSLAPISALEKKRFNKTLPRWYRVIKPVFFILFFANKILNRNYTEKPALSFAIFTEESLRSRKTVTIKNPGFRLKFKN
jgi:glycosyltransferase involved in cell wall biosynthesis